MALTGSILEELFQTAFAKFVKRVDASRDTGGAIVIPACHRPLKVPTRSISFS